MTTRTVTPQLSLKQEVFSQSGRKMDGVGRYAIWLSRLVLAAATFVFVAISVKYIGDPVGAAAAFKISLGSPAAITNMRVGFGAFPLGFAIITFSSLISTARHLRGLFFLMTIIGAATAARILGIVVDGPAAESLYVLRPELAMLTLSIVAILLETDRRRALLTDHFIGQRDART